MTNEKEMLYKKIIKRAIDINVEDLTKGQSTKLLRIYVESLYEDRKEIEKVGVENEVYKN